MSKKTIIDQGASNFSNREIIELETCASELMKRMKISQACGEPEEWYGLYNNAAIYLAEAVAFKMKAERK